MKLQLIMKTLTRFLLLPVVTLALLISVSGCSKPGGKNSGKPDALLTAKPANP